MISVWSSNKPGSLLKALAVAALALFLASSGPAQIPEDRIEDEKAIRDAMAQIESAFVSRDHRPFEKFYREDYVSVRSKPIYNGRQQLVAMVRSDAETIRAGRGLDYETLAYESGTPRIRYYGNAAVVSVEKLHSWRYSDKKCLTRLQSTDLWVKGANGWQIAAGHATAKQCDPLPWHPPHRAVLEVGTRTKPWAAGDIQLQREIISAYAKDRAGPGLFAADPVHTGSDASVVTGDAAVEAGLALFRANVRDTESVQVFGDGAIFTFRIKEVSEARVSIYHASAMLVRLDGAWRVAATHVSKLD